MREIGNFTLQCSLTAFFGFIDSRKHAMLYITGAAGLTRRFMKVISGRWSNLTLTASTTSTFRSSGREKESSIGSDTSTSNYYIDPYMQWAPEEDTPTQVQALLHNSFSRNEKLQYVSMNKYRVKKDRESILKFPLFYLLPN